MPKSPATAYLGGIAALAVILFAASCSESMDSATRSPEGTDEMDMQSDARSAALNKKIPPIDTAAPPIFETATFGLG
jgi:hypothetical protein